MFVPATPSSELRNTIQNIVNKKTSELWMSVRVIVTCGRKVCNSLVRLDLTGCFYPKCLACKSGLEGASHTRSGVQNYITCKICNTQNILAEYHWESGFNAVHRLSEHEADIKNKNNKNGMVKHLIIFHKENIGDPDSFQYSSVTTFQKRLEQQISEGVAITNSDLNHSRREHILMNSLSCPPQNVSLQTSQKWLLKRTEFTPFLNLSFLSSKPKYFLTQATFPHCFDKASR